MVRKVAHGIESVKLMSIIIFVYLQRWPVTLWNTKNYRGCCGSCISGLLRPRSSPKNFLICILLIETSIPR